MKYALLLTYLFVYIIRPAEWIPLLRFNWQLIFGLIAIVVISNDFLSNQSKFIKDKFGLIVLYFFIISLFSVSMTGWLGGVQIHFDQFLPAILIYYLIQITCKNIRDLNKVMTFLLILVSFIGISSILQIRTGMGFGGVTSVAREIGHDEFGNIISTQQVRWYGVFNDPNDLGLLFIACTPYAIQQLLAKRFLYIIPLFITVTGVALTNSRGTFVSLLVSVITYFILITKNVRGIIIAGILCAVMIVLGPSRISQINTTEESAVGRLEAWVAAFQMMKQSPIYGVGPNTFTDYHFITAHNSYMLAMAETGFIGLMCFLGITIVPIGYGVKMIFNSKNVVLKEQPLCSVLAAFVGTCIAIFFISRTYMMIPYMMSALLVSCMKSFNIEIYESKIRTLNTWLLVKITLIFTLIMFVIAKLT